MNYTDKFLISALWMLGHEVGFVNNPRDPGGATNFGIAQRYHPGVDVVNLTVDGALQIYFAEYWTTPLIATTAWPVCAKLLDMAVQFGTDPAVRALQHALYRMGRKVSIDGRLGPVTIAELGALHGNTVVRALCGEAYLAYNERLAAGASSTFAAGWFTRAALQP